MGFVYDTILANADFCSCVVQMHRLCFKHYNNLHIFFFVAFEPFCFPSVRFHCISTVLGKLHVCYDHTVQGGYAQVVDR